MASHSAAVLPARKALVLEQKKPGEWHVSELTIVGDKIASERLVQRAYYRDLAEQAAAKYLRGAARK